MLESTGQFVLLEHVQDTGRHWDLMFEAGAALATWQLTKNPIFKACGQKTEPILAQRLADHRRTYLNYQGQISGGRGSVTRLDQGQYLLIEQQPDRIKLTLCGQSLHGKYELIKSPTNENMGEGDYWVLSGGLA